MAKVIHFRNTAGSHDADLQPEDVRIVVVQDKNFFEPFSYSTNNEEQFLGFFKKLIAGRLSLYRYKDRLFVKKADGPLREVTKKRKQVDATLIADDYTGLGILRTLIRECQSMDEQFLLDNFNSEIGIKKIVNRFNSCFPEGTTEIEDLKVPSHIDVGIIAMLSETKLNFSKTFLSNANFKWSTSVGGGVLLSLFTSSMGDNLRFVAEPSFGQFRGYSYFQNSQGTNDLFLKFSYVRVPVMLRYFYKSMFVDFGANNMIVITNHTTWRLESPNINNVNFITTEEGRSYHVNTAALGLTGGIGLRANIAGMPLLTSVRVSSILRSTNDRANNQAGVNWLDLNVALQLTRH